MKHILDLDKQSDELISVFKKIQSSNTILFLGAGASVGEKRYLSKEIIEYYEDEIGKKFNEPNITKFVDYLSADINFTRSHFDHFVVNMLQKYEVTDAHRIMASIPWRELITTNYDLLVERAFDEVAKTHRHIYDLKVIRNVKQYNYKESNSEVRYIKLNGCIQDISLYPLAFSSDDFTKLKTFYKTVLNDLKNLSPDVSFLSIGYSFGDGFGIKLIEEFDAFNYREKKWIITVDPYPNESILSYYTSKRICIVKCSFQEFFHKYYEWENANSQLMVQKKGLSVVNSQNFSVTIPSKLLLNLDGIIKQLNLQTRDKFIKEEDFYRGEEPNFSIITRGVDVIKSAYIQSFISTILDTNNSNSSNFIPLYFITGDFGIGKSTFTLRLIYELEKQSDLDLIAFEIIDLDKLRREYVVDLLSHCKTKNVVFFCDEVEIESYFKSLLSIRRELSIEQLQECNVFLIVPIRENILEKYKQYRQIPCTVELKLNGKLTEVEIDDLLEKLRACNLVSYRDAFEKNLLNEKIQREYDSDSFISLMSIITSGRHENDLLSCYNQLSEDCKKAFLYTALIHQHKLLMPSNWLKQNISMTWDDFLARIVKGEGKGILLQEEVVGHGTQPDLFFKTKHSLIAKKLVERIISNSDKQFVMYKEMLKKVELGQTNSYLVSNLLKSLKRSGEFNDFQLNELYDAAYDRLKDDPYYLLNYAINLQERKNRFDIKKALDLLIYAESLLEHRNHRFIHRRAVLNFELAKQYFETESILNFTNIYLKEARELFVIKQLTDPFSSYSYVDYISMTVWELNNINMDKETEMQKQILVEDLFELAERTVTEGIDRVYALHSNYSQYLSKTTQNIHFKEYLDDLYNQPNLRPYACILLYKYYFEKNNIPQAESMVEEMEYYQDNYEVIKFLHKYYCNRIYDPNYRVKLIRISNENPKLEKDNPLRYYYFRFVSETYNYQFHSGRNYLNSIQKTYNNLNPEYHNVWKDTDGSDKNFEAKIVQNFGESSKAVKIPSMQLTVKLLRGNYEKYPIGCNVVVKLHFYLFGLMAEIVNILSTD